ncbi:phosphoribosyltransferase family protein [Ralstonia insidiosa]|jgi:putative phosphoribosyl transferase|uniref:phosphoribosyltransferase n=1 Tax=Ralstonia TaxID=48736 RepID=UPI00066491EF|nr:phosphoribosyltransferase family protein [Ralstonia insidiosa]KMW44636.1 phosphoribosyltransferase [Ralstonia sp. MD27]MBX3775291.1 phosphoribosyltransferase [Ralstonia pickettii]NOZ18030.1 phosphoribosyltransferase [Betaproteobacteria bacterium]MBA9859388.1 phosphoribosyltransferase [Ralstonia insidiosa]MBA9872836.1 phosphoribosyltransferase [Ralstonia insidiosa]
MRAPFCDRFRDRADAGRQLAAALATLDLPAPRIVLALPRGGVPVGYAIARALNATLGVLLVRKLGAPWQPELALGALADCGAGLPPHIEWNTELLDAIGPSQAYLDEVTAQELAELERRRTRYGVVPLPLAGATVIVTDDGIATGATMRAALAAVRRAKPGRLVLAVPTAPETTWHTLRAEVDDGRCLIAPPDFSFQAVGQYYGNFDQTEDSEVIALLADVAQRNPH